MNQEKLKTYALAFLKQEIEDIERILEGKVRSSAEYVILKRNLEEYKRDYEELTAQ